MIVSEYSCVTLVLLFVKLSSREKPKAKDCGLPVFLSKLPPIVIELDPEFRVTWPISWAVEVALQAQYL